MDTQANSEKKCNAEGKKDHLISNQICSSFSTGNSSQEFWTGIQRYKYTESLTDIKNCVYVRCENGNVPVENTGDCGQQIEGFACFFNGTSTTVNTEQPSPESSLESTLISSTEPILLHVESTSKNFVGSSLNTRSTEANNISTTSNNTADKNKTETAHSKSKSVYSTTTWNSYSRSHNMNTESTSEISEYSSEDASKTSESSSQNTTSIKTNNIDKSTLAYNTTVTNKPETNHSASEIIYSKTTWKSYTRRHTSKTGNSILPTSVISETTSDKDRVSAFMNTSSKLPIFSNTYMSSTAHTSDLNNKSGTELNGRKKISSTVTRPQNDSSSDQLNTGLIVGISVSILSLLVLIIGVFGIRRLRNQRAWKESSLDFSSPINTKKETKVIENDSTYPVVSANDDDKSFRPTDTTSNSNTNKPNNPYAVVVKKAVSNKSDTTSNGKETKSNNADDPYAIVVKIPEKNQNQDEQTSLDIPDSTYDSTHQPRSISDNESGNISDTSTGHCDDSDPS
ncbi:uncharacterized protein LOC143053965 [Mytilus galloprovincialis]|uniref:uncharacterized protein LOC143053965 n=1 Tax=Mytilus galloprovincialis TaxID=29158 RepID=UPI003F7B5EF1